MDLCRFPTKTKRNIINTFAEDKLKLYSIYSPAHNKNKIIHKTKQSALRDEQEE